MTHKGRTRGLLQAWGAFFDRELRAAERLGLVNVPRQVDEFTVCSGCSEWPPNAAATKQLRRLDDQPDRLDS